MPKKQAQVGEKELPRNLSFYVRLDTGHSQQGHPDYIVAKLRAPIWGVVDQPVEHNWFFLRVREKWRDLFLARFLLDKKHDPSVHEDIVGDFKLFYDTEALTYYFSTPVKKEELEDKLPPAYCVLGAWVQLHQYTNVKHGLRIDKEPALFINPKAVALRYGYDNDISGKEILLIQKHCSVLPLPPALLNFPMWMGYHR